MSRVQNLAQKKPFCKVCQDAGKPESLYSSHFVRSLPDKSGKTTVLCPTLLSTECRYCFKSGHTAKFCPVIEKTKKDKERTERKVQFEASKPSAKIESKKAVSVFAVLGEDSDSENELKVSNFVQEEYPSLKKHIELSLPKVSSDVKSGWAAALAKPKQEYVKEDTYAKELEARSILKALPQSASKPEPIVVKTLDHIRDYNQPIFTRNWADWTDSDDSDDEDEVVKPVVKANAKAAVAVNYDSDW